MRNYAVDWNGKSTARAEHVLMSGTDPPLIDAGVHSFLI